MSLTQKDLNEIEQRLKRIFATKKDLSESQSEMVKYVNENIKYNIDSLRKELLEAFDERTSNLPTKDEFFGAMDELMKEVKAGREETTILSHRSSDHEDRIEKIEDKLHIATS